MSLSRSRANVTWNNCIEPVKKLAVDPARYSRHA